jgi:hypothetical protein
MGETKVVRDFDLGDILSVTTDTVVSPRGFKGIHELVEFICGQEVHVHQMSKIVEVCQIHILHMHPALRGVDASTVNEKTWPTWMEAQKQRFGSVLPIEPLRANHGLVGNPIAEGQEQFGRDNMVVIDPDPK